MFTQKAIINYLSRLNSAIDFYAQFPVESLEIAISTGNKKVGNVWNISEPPIITCPNCTECKNLCYDIKACNQYPNVIKARARNYSILKRNADLYWKQLRDKLARKRTNKYFRFHVGGDFPSIEYLTEMVKTAKLFPEFRFWTYTKAYYIVNRYVKEHGNSRRKAIPENLSIMFSEWRGVPMDNPYGFPEFRVHFKDEPEPVNVFKCPGNCRICIEQHRGCIVGETTYVDEH